jgi:serine/threonine protein kinase
LQAVNSFFGTLRVSTFFASVGEFSSFSGFLVLAGVYTLPSYLSAETQDLIQRMLAVDPIQRISISEIRY